MAARVREPFFLSGGVVRPLGTVVYDLVSFTTFLIFLVLCWLLGAPAYMLDNVLGTRLLDRLIGCFEFFGR